MSGPTRPIPISQGHRSQRSSPIGTNAADTGSDAAAAHDGVSPNAMISQSCPVVNGHGTAYFGPRHAPPRAPVIGSLPEPSFMLGGNGDDMMPELVLPPPAQESNNGARRREASVVQVASSCPVDMSFFRQDSPAQPRSWMPSPRASDEFDLSKSPALAMMSAMRQARRRPSFDTRRVDEDHLAQGHDRLSHSQDPPAAGRSLGIVGARRISDPPFRSTAAPSNSFVSTSSHHLYSDDRLNADVQAQVFGLENLSLDGAAPNRFQRTPSDELPGLPPRRPERRGGCVEFY